MALILIDKSAWVHARPKLAELGDLRLCAITRLEILHSARSAADYEALDADLGELPDLRVDHTTLRSALAAQRDLAREGRHRLPMADLIIAACAQQHGADVAHVDRHFELLARHMGFRSIRVAT